MTDEMPRPKRMGRPPKHPDQGKRPSLSLRVPQALYDQIATAAAESGRSLSEEMEARVTEAFRQAQPDAVKKAVDAALWDQSEAHVDKFGGRIGYSWHLAQNHFFLAAMEEAYNHFGISDPSRISDEFIEFVFSKMSEAQPKVRGVWRARIAAGRAALALSDPEVRANLQRLWDEDPSFRQLVMDKLGRA